jgi:hypothetical protein
MEFSNKVTVFYYVGMRGGCPPNPWQQQKHLSQVALENMSSNEMGVIPSEIHAKYSPKQSILHDCARKYLLIPNIKARL